MIELVCNDGGFFLNHLANPHLSRFDYFTHSGFEGNSEFRLVGIDVLRKKLKMKDTPHDKQHFVNILHEDPNIGTTRHK